MATVLELHPRAGADFRARSRFRSTGLTLAAIGVALAVAVLIGGISAGVLAGRTGEETTVGQILAWTFGLATTAFGTVKVGIAVILMGVLVRLWLRVDGMKAALPALKARAGGGPVESGTIETAYGRATVSPSTPRPLLIHRMARTLWAPMLVIGAMGVGAGLLVSLVQSDNVTSDPSLSRSLSAWAQGLQFLGEGMLLAGISFLLGTILHGLRTGGGEVQETLGLAVKTLQVPTTARLFVGLMMLGLMVEVFQFIVYVVVATIDDPTSVAAFFAWLGPVREVGLGLLLSGIALALATIARVLGFQFWRIREIIATGR